MKNLEYSTLEELEDKYIGTHGTPRRDAYEAALEEEIHAYNIGEAIKHTRKARGFTQEQLGRLMGVKKAQVSRIENGHNINLSTLAKAFKAMGVHADLTLGNIKFALW